jgi:hypothetical protein
LIVFVCCFVVLLEPAYPQSVAKAKLTISNIGLNPIADGFYNASVNLVLQRPGSPQVNFGIFVQHVKTLDEVYDKVRPEAERLVDELKNADIEIPR